MSHNVYPSLRGKRVIVTGGASGIGFGVSESLAREGFDLALCGRRQESAVAESLALLLRSWGCQVHVVHDGESALAQAARDLPDVVLLDIGLPGMDGIEVCRRIRREPWGGAIKIVAVTGWGQDEDRRKSMEAGFDHHLVKPIEYGELESVL